MKQAVRAIIIRGDSLLVMHRSKFGDQYYTLIGGGIGVGETPEMALARELHEETGLRVVNPRLVFVEDAGSFYGRQYVFLCDDPGGDIAMHPQADEAHIGSGGVNVYTPLWLSIAQLPTVPFLSNNLRRRLIDGLERGWPVQTETFTTQH
jgi:8-oxo-dGTP pyrophosphatase MutT (NUDIX family)